MRVETETIYPKYVLLSKVDSILKANLSPEGSIQTDDDLNAIMIPDVRSRIERIKEILKTLDIPPKQVLIEGKIAILDLPVIISLIEQLDKEGKADVSSIPSITVQNNKQGEVYLSEFGLPYNVGLPLIPQIGAEEFMSLNI